MLCVSLEWLKLKIWNKYQKFRKYFMCNLYIFLINWPSVAGRNYVQLKAKIEQNFRRFEPNKYVSLGGIYSIVLRKGFLIWCAIVYKLYPQHLCFFDVTCVDYRHGTCRGTLTTDTHTLHQRAFLASDWHKEVLNLLHRTRTLVDGQLFLRVDNRRWENFSPKNVPLKLVTAM